MGLMTSQLRRFRAWSFLLGFVVPKLILLFTTAGWSAQPYSINFGFYYHALLLHFDLIHKLVITSCLSKHVFTSIENYSTTILTLSNIA